MLIVGPNATFLRYIAPGAAVAGRDRRAAAHAVGELFPGVTARPGRAGRGRRGQGPGRDGRRARRGGRATGSGCPTTPLEIERRRRSRCGSTGRPARRGPGPGPARPAGRTTWPAPVFAAEIVDALAAPARRPRHRRRRPLGGDDAPATCSARPTSPRSGRELRAEPRASRRALRPAVAAAHPAAAAARPVRRPGRLAAAAPGLTEAERALLRRAPGGGWTPADVPLLDEAAELLGEDDRRGAGPRAAAAPRGTDRVRRRARWTSLHGLAARIDVRGRAGAREILTAADLLDAGRLAERQRRAGAARPPRERAAADRTLDVRARHRGRGAGAVADGLAAADAPLPEPVDDASSATSPRPATWPAPRPGGEVLAPYVGDRWRLAELTVNYRTPGRDHGGGRRTCWPASTRRCSRRGRCGRPGCPRGTGRCRRASWPPRLVGRGAARAGRAWATGGSAVIVPAGRAASWPTLVAAAVPTRPAAPARPGEPGGGADRAAGQGAGVRLGAGGRPGRASSPSPRAARNDLYVALTRATQRLGVLHAEPLPPALHRLVPAAAAVS